MEKTQFKSIIDNDAYRYFLFDASGVLYNKPQGLINGVKESVNYIKSLNKSIFLVTNNSMLCPKDISKYLYSVGISWPEETIISSGLGCFYDQKCKSLIQNKNVYISGNKSSYFYAKEAKKICSKLSEAETIILSSNPLDIKSSYYAELCKHLKGNHNVNVVCINPDKYIRQYDTKKAVIGYWAEYIEKVTNKKIYYFGKPYKNYFEMLKQILETKFNVKDLNACCYIDDWIDNISGCHLEVKKIWCYETGLGKFFKGTELQQEKIDIIINSASLYD